MAFNQADGSAKPYVFSASAGTAYAAGTKTPHADAVSSKQTVVSEVPSAPSNKPSSIWHQVNFNIDAIVPMRRPTATTYAIYETGTDDSGLDYTGIYDASLDADKSAADLILDKPLDQHNLSLSDLSSATINGNVIPNGYVDLNIMLSGNFPDFTDFSLSDALANPDSELHVDFGFYTDSMYGKGRSSIVQQLAVGQLVISDKAILPNGVALPSRQMETADSDYTPVSAGDVGAVVIRWKGSPYIGTPAVISNDDGFVSPPL
jgi:hypothetical protein